MIDKFKRFGVIAVLAFAAIGLLHLRSCVREKLGTPTASNGASPSPLSSKDKEAISYNSDTHIATVDTPTGEKKIYTRDPIIHIQKDGSVKIDRKIYGLEFSPFIGMGYGGGPRLHLGASWAYAWRFDLNTSLAISLDKNMPRTIEPVVSLSYNFWRDTSVFAGTDPVRLLLQQRPGYHVGLQIRF